MVADAYFIISLRSMLNIDQPARVEVRQETKKEFAKVRIVLLSLSL